MLFPVIEGSGLCRHPANQHLVFLRNPATERYRTGLRFTHRERLCCLINRLFCHRVVETDACLSGYLLHRQVDERSHQHSLISLPHEARQVRLNHKRFGSHRLVFTQTVIEDLRMSQSQETPFRQCIGHLELQAHPAQRIGMQVRIEESRLRKILAQRESRSSLSGTGIGHHLILHQYGILHLYGS